MKTPSPIYPLVALGLALMFAMIGALSPPPSGSRGPAFKKNAFAVGHLTTSSTSVSTSDSSAASRTPSVSSGRSASASTRLVPATPSLRTEK
jgi:hypothetical protein